MLQARSGTAGTSARRSGSSPQMLVARGKVDEAERLALQAIETVGPRTTSLDLRRPRMALGLVRAAQGTRRTRRSSYSATAVDGFAWRTGS